MNNSKHPILKDKYVRSVIKLGNSYAMTFPQDWARLSKLREKTEVSLYPLDDKTLIIKSQEKEEKKTYFRIDGKKWPIKLIRQALIAAFKLGVDEIYVSYNSQKLIEFNELFVELRREIIGLDFKNLRDREEFQINFLLDNKKITFNEVIEDLSDAFNTVIKNFIEGNTRNNNQLILDEVDRKYSLGTRILVMGLSNYPISKNNSPTIRYLGNRVILLYIRDFITEALNLELISNKTIKKYSEFLLKILNLLDDIINNYDNINLDAISEFQEYLDNLEHTLDEFKTAEINIEEQHIRKIIEYYLNCFKTFFDIGITRLIETEIGIV